MRSHLLQVLCYRPCLVSPLSNAHEASIAHPVPPLGFLRFPRPDHGLAAYTSNIRRALYICSASQACLPLKEISLVQSISFPAGVL